MKQRRRVCPDCGLENVYRTPMAGGNMPDGNCIKCGSPELRVVEFEGLFDYSTDYTQVAQILASPDVPTVAAVPLVLQEADWPPAWVTA